MRRAESRVGEVHGVLPVLLALFSSVLFLMNLITCCGIRIRPELEEGRSLILPGTERRKVQTYILVFRASSASFSSFSSSSQSNQGKSRRPSRRNRV